MTNFKVYQVRQHNVGQTVAQMLRKVFGNTRSWGQIKQIIDSRRVQINGNLCLDEARRLKAGEVLRIYDESLAKPAQELDLNIRFQDEHLLVVEKPPALTTLRHREEAEWDDKRKSREPTLDELLQRIIDRHGLSRLPGRGAAAGGALQKSRKDLADQTARGRAHVKVRAVHRLDRDTSGLMLFALTQPAEQALVKLFAGHEIERAYLAVCQGKIESRTFNTQFVRDRGDGLRGSLPPGQTSDDAKHAVTHIKLVRHIGEKYSLIDCKLETGRTHQIRIHLAEAGHPLCGEKVYNRPRPGAEPIIDPSGAPRHALHAHRLAFIHPITGKPHTFESKLPRDLHRWLNKIEKEAGAE
ncbi:MAG TPA: RluA family pseudouridine synthase [Tepidisphaeraceae bacterium]|jgi:23S rRNA pseudouridine1911/1915/1917 synthase